MIDIPRSLRPATDKSANARALGVLPEMFWLTLTSGSRIKTGGRYADLAGMCGAGSVVDPFSLHQSGGSNLDHATLLSWSEARRARGGSTIQTLQQFGKSA